MVAAETAFVDCQLFQCGATSEGGKDGRLGWVKLTVVETELAEAGQLGADDLAELVHVDAVVLRAESAEHAFEARHDDAQRAEIGTNPHCFEQGRSVEVVAPQRELSEMSEIVERASVAPESVDSERLNGGRTHERLQCFDLADVVMLGVMQVDLLELWQWQVRQDVVWIRCFLIVPGQSVRSETPQLAGEVEDTSVGSVEAWNRQV